MDAIFDEEPKVRRKIRGLEKARIYLRTKALKDPTEELHVECTSPSECNYLDDKTSWFPIHDNGFGVLQFAASNLMVVESGPILLALLLEEYDAAEKLVDAIDVLSLCSIGSWTYRNHELTLEVLLYSPAHKIPEQLRDKILGRLEAEGDDLCEWSLKQVAAFGDEGIREIFVSDVRKYPKLFGQSSLYARDLASLNFMLTVFPSDDCANALLENNEIHEYFGKTEFMSSAEWKKRRIKEDIRELSKTVRKLEKRRDTHINLYALLIGCIFKLRQMIEAFPEEEKFIWKMTDVLPFEEKDFESLLNKLRADGKKNCPMEILYELALRKLGKRMHLQAILHGGDTLLSFLGLEKLSCQIGSLWGGLPGKADRIRIMSLLHCVSNIEYPDTLTVIDRRRYLTAVILQHADEMKEFFSDLLRKGLVPEEDLEYVMARIKDKEKCEYMRPFLILQKYGGLPDEVE